MRHLLALALLALGPPMEVGPEGPIFSTPGATSSVTPCSNSGAVVYRLLHDAGDESNITDLCDTYASGFDGGYFCLRPDGTGTGAALTPSASPPTTANLSVCGNGSHCGALDHQKLNGTNQFWSTANQASPTGAMTGCVVAVPDNISGTQRLISKAVGTVVLQFGVANGFLTVSVAKAGGTLSTVSSAAAWATRTRNVACFRYKYVADGTSLLNLWQNGVSVGTPLTNAVGPPAVVSNAYYVGSTAGGAAGFYSGMLGGAFLTEVYFDDATMAAITNTALGKLTPGVGTAPTFTRTTINTCANTAGSELSTMRVNQPCLTQGAMLREAGITNACLRSEAFDNATWTKVSDGVTAIPVVTADSTDVVDPFGGTAADKIVFPAVSGAGKYSLLRQTFTGSASATTFSGSVYLKTASGTATVYLGFSISTPTYFSNVCNVTTTWTRCPLKGKTLTAATWNIDIGVNLNDPGQAAQSGSTIYAIGGQIELGRRPTSYVPTTTAGVARTADALSISNPVAASAPSWCMGATLNPAGLWSEIATSRYIAAFGAQASANTANLTVSESRAAQFDTYGSNAVLKERLATAFTDDTSARRFVGQSACAEKVMLIDGVNSGATTGAGTGIIVTQPATAYFGNRSTSANQAHGLMSDMRFAESSTGCD